MSKSELTSEIAIDVLNKILKELQMPGNVQKLEDARNNVGNEMLKVMQFLFPVVMEIQMNVIKEYGYTEGREGIIKFLQSLRNLERDDPEISHLHSLIKNYYLPPVSVHTTNESPAEEKAGGT